jgi:hypothetical protein
MDASPLTVPIDVAGELIGVPRQTAYRMAKAGALPVMPGPGRSKVPTAKLSALLGVEITAAHIEDARARLAPKRAALLDYQASYRRERATLTAKTTRR